MRSTAPTDYYDAIRKAGERASSAIDAIYQDIGKKRGELRYLGSGERNALVKQIRGLYDVGKLMGKTAVHGDACIHAPNTAIIANDAGLLSQTDGVLTPYHITMLARETINPIM